MFASECKKRGWKLYELINPSDPYTFYAPDIKIAYVIASQISPHVCATEVGAEDNITPMMMGFEEFEKKHGIDSEWVKNLDLQVVIDALDTFVIGRVEERQSLDRACDYMSEEQRREYLAERQDMRRQSMNQIGELAQDIRNALIKQLEDKKNGTEETAADKNIYEVKWCLEGRYEEIEIEEVEAVSEQAARDVVNAMHGKHDAIEIIAVEVIED